MAGPKGKGKKAKKSPGFIIHWIGTLMVLASVFLLLVTSISAPERSDVAILQIDVIQRAEIRNATVNLGGWGYCVNDLRRKGEPPSFCNRGIGYDAKKAIESTLAIQLGNAVPASNESLSKALIGPPIACFIAFLAFIICSRAGTTGNTKGIIANLMGSIFAFVAFALTLTVMAIDFGYFMSIREAINSQISRQFKAEFGTGAWTAVAAVVLQLVGALCLLFSSCTGRKKYAKAMERKKLEAKGYVLKPQLNTLGAVGNVQAPSQSGFVDRKRKKKKKMWFCC